MDDNKPDRWELRRPELLLHELQKLFPFDVPRTLLARIDGHWSDQRLITATELWRHPAVDEFERTTVTERALERLGLGFGSAPYAEWPIVLAVVVRPGDCWWSFDEREVHLGLRYGSNLADAVNGDIITVTARGWYSQLDQLYRREPAAVWAADAA